jgi:pSer/pThr/pTyr-binding forkhead associated (FHA) protein
VDSDAPSVQDTGRLPRLTDRDRRRGAGSDLEPGRYLAVEDGEDVVHLRIENAVTRLGRGMTSTVPLDDPTVSRRHALIVEREGGSMLYDERSTNGTWLNGERVRESALADGDLIQLGAVRLRFREIPPAS